MKDITKNKRKEKDLMKLMMSNYEVALLDENNSKEFFVVFYGPKDSSYEGVTNIFKNREFGKCMFYCLNSIHLNHQA